MNKRKSILLSLAGVIGLMIVTIGVSYAFFNYAKSGTKENVLTTGTITFLYTETDKAGTGINISDALPTSDSVGKSQMGSGKVFNFKIESTTPSNMSIPYVITARMKDTSTLSKDVVKLYLTKLSGTETPTDITGINGIIYNDLVQYDKVTDHDERIIYQDIIPNSTTNYLQEFNLRMWIIDGLDYSSGNYDGKSFTLNINVYSDATVYKQINSTMQSNDLANPSKLWAHVSTVTKIIFQDEIRQIPNTVYEYDISADGNNSVMARIIVDPDDSTKHIAYIQGDDGIYAPTNSSYLFKDFSVLENMEGIEYFDTSKVTNMAGMFYQCKSLTDLDLSSFDTSNVVNMEFMFYHCRGLTNLDLNSFDTSNVTNMYRMFYYCIRLTNLDLSSFATSSLNITENMFMFCSKLTNLDLSNADFKKVDNKTSMFTNVPTTITVTVLDAAAETFIRSVLTGGTINIAG